MSLSTQSRVWGTPPLPVWGGIPSTTGLGHLAASSPSHPGETSQEGSALTKPLSPGRCCGVGVSAPPTIRCLVSSQLIPGATRGSCGCPGLLGQFAPELSHPRSQAFARRAGTRGSRKWADSPLVWKLFWCGQAASPVAEEEILAAARSCRHGSPEPLCPL